MAQLELFAQPAAPVATAPTVESVRARLEAVLAPLRSGSEPSWSARDAARWKLVVPQMADWLPPQEREAVRAEFAALVQAL